MALFVKLQSISFGDSYKETLVFESAQRYSRKFVSLKSHMISKKSNVSSVSSHNKIFKKLRRCNVVGNEK